tara:strand:+ start:6729 stop:6935 length:207 start_codon:yes stop_codon:yes gene_type:complete
MSRNLIYSMVAILIIVAIILYKNHKYKLEQAARETGGRSSTEVPYTGVLTVDGQAAESQTSGDSVTYS